jgi:hypothetical protein
MEIAEFSFRCTKTTSSILFAELTLYVRSWKGFVVKSSVRNFVEGVHLLVGVCGEDDLNVPL